ncbi:FIST signal transduction protein [Methanotorris formicicus]|uniref:Uncharacterized protein n=1 Tax=Methanotorris formicicus Mc-S-70 TaxID=647171 RepID=H1KWS6_9EURY|nr:FIST N-terminal domain-containing protein [Methanotorris formicicus]EHP89059.1 protein of unknown function DUF1745 [Methanotorris formicicus Mc-S-70]
MKFIEFSYGISNDENPLKAGAYATSNALKYLDTSLENINIVFLYSSPDYDPEEVLNGVKLILGNKIPIIGGSSKFGIVDGNLIEDGVVVGILASKYFHVGLGVALGASINPRECGRKAVHDAIKNLGMLPRMVMVFMDYCKFEEEIINGIVDVLGFTIPIFGGVTSDNFEFKKTYQYCNDVYIDSVVCVAFGGDIVPKISVGKITDENLDSNKKITITETNKRYVYELNGVNAIEYYKNITNFRGSNQNLENDKKFYLSNAFGVTDSNGEIYLKGPIFIKNGVLVFGSNVMGGNELSLFSINEESIENFFEKSVKLINNAPPNYPPSVTFCCISSYLTEISKESVEKCLKSCPLNPIFGFTTYGEVVLKNYYNYTVSMCSLVPDLASISAKEGIHMITKYPATKETILKINELGGSTKIEELAKALGIHRRTAYDRIEPLLQYGFVEKDHALVKITDFGKLLLKIIKK